MGSQPVGVHNGLSLWTRRHPKLPNAENLVSQNPNPATLEFTPSNIGLWSPGSWDDRVWELEAPQKILRETNQKD